MFEFVPPDVLVTLNGKAITTKLGKFTFEHVEDTPFSLAISKDGYVTQTIDKTFAELEQLEPLTKLTLKRDLAAEMRMDQESLAAFQKGDSRRSCQILQNLAERDAKYLQPPLVHTESLTETRDVVANKIGLSKPGNLLVVAGNCPTIKLFPIDTFPQPTSQKVVAQPYSYLTGISLSPNGKWLGAITDDTDPEKHKTFLWTLSGKTPQQRLLDYHREPTQHAKFSGDSNWLVTSANAKKVAVWKLSDLSKPAGEFTGHGDIVYAIAISQDGKQVVVVGDDQIQLCEVADNSTTPLLFMNAGDTIYSVKGCAFAKQDQVLAVAVKVSPKDGSALQRQLVLSDFRHRKVARINLGAGNINGLRTYKDEVLLFDSTHIWSWKLTADRLPTGSGTKYLRHGPNITAVTRDSTGSWLISCSTDKSVILWQRGPDGQLLASYALPAKTLLYDVAVVDDKWLVAVGDGAKIYVWDFVRCQRLLAYQQFVAAP